MPLTVTRCASTSALTISGTVAGQRIRRRASSDDLRLAREEAAALEVEILRTQWRGERRGARTFADAVTSYLEAAPRSESTKARVRRLLLVIGTITLGEIDQGTIARLKTAVLRPGASPAIVSRGIIVPLRAILRHAHRRGWCDAPTFEIPRRPDGRTRCLLPCEAERLIAVGAPHVRPLLVFLLSTGARMSEAIELDWRDLDLRGGRAIFWRTKTGKRRIAMLPPRAVEPWPRCNIGRVPSFVGRRPAAPMEPRHRISTPTPTVGAKKAARSRQPGVGLCGAPASTLS